MGEPEPAMALVRGKIQADFARQISELRNFERQLGGAFELDQRDVMMSIGAERNGCPRAVFEKPIGAMSRGKSMTGGALATDFTEEEIQATDGVAIGKRVAFVQ